jgi:hypothetical protein
LREPNGEKEQSEYAECLELGRSTNSTYHTSQFSISLFQYAFVSVSRTTEDIIVVGAIQIQGAHGAHSFSIESLVAVLVSQEIVID